LLSVALISVILVLALAPAALAQDATATAASQQTPPTATVPASPAQLKREHDRAVKAGDTANDPFDSSSSDALNQQQLQAAQGASPIVMPPATDVPANATIEAVPDDSPAPDSVPPSPDVSPPTTDDSLSPPNPVAPH